MIDPKDLNKPSLRKEFAKKPEEYYAVELFKREGFSRHTCKICAKNFWATEETQSCKDSSHTQYSFFREKPRPIRYCDFWNDFAGFFKRNGHEEVKRYPVVSRWRQDLYFTIASIQDFQRIENGKMGFEYSANPLIVPQVCLRFSDIQNVGVTGRHFTGFTMGGQQSFNYPKEGYWKDRTIELNFDYLTKVLGVKKSELIYGEDVWAMGDFSEFGPSLESFAMGAELVNSVFTQFEFMNGKVSELPGKVVDVGWGFERLMWFYSGFDTAYEAVFYYILRKIQGRIDFEVDNKLFRKFSALSSELDVTERGGKTKEHALLKKAGITQQQYENGIRPLQALYAALDHARTLLFAITDGALPSNIGGGYNLRIILRRSLSFIEEYGFRFDLNELAALQAEDLKGIFPELSDNLDLFAKVVDIEARRYARTRENAGKVIDAILSKSEKIDAKQLRTLYESNGITPELIEAEASKKNVRVEMPDSSYEDIIKGDFASKEKGSKLEVDVSGLQKTEQLYYKLAEQSISKVLLAQKNYVVLDATPFYPEGGGQEADHGTISGVQVADVQKIGEVIVHVMKDDVSASKEFMDGASVECRVDGERRRRLMVHHTSVHLMSAAARSVLGKHAWQEGTRKSYDKAHIDIAHYDKLSGEDVNRLEGFINSNLFNGIKVTVKHMDRKQAESEYGFEIYQGHGVPSKSIRMVIIESKDGRLIDAEACGGLHVAGMEQAIGTVKIRGTERISDGVDRIELVAGSAALDYFRSTLGTLSEAASRLNCDVSGVSGKIEKLMADNRALIKDSAQADGIYQDIIASGDMFAKKEVIMELGLGREHLVSLATKAASRNKGSVVMLTNPAGDVVCIAGDGSGANAVEFIKSHMAKRKFLGGGTPRFAQGKIA